MENVVGFSLVYMLNRGEKVSGVFFRRVFLSIRNYG